MPRSFSRASNHILKRLCLKWKRIDIIFDKKISLSFKDLNTVNDLNVSEPTWSITSHVDANQQRLSEFIKVLQNDILKRKFVIFLIRHWSTDDSLVEIIGLKTVLKINENYCYSFLIHEVKITKTEEKNRRSDILKGD